jgi:hypothetical protein
MGRISLAFSAFTHFPSEDGSLIYWAIEVGFGWQEVGRCSISQSSRLLNLLRFLQLRSLATSLSSKMSCFHAREYFKEARFHCSFASTPSRSLTERHLNGIVDYLEKGFGNRLRACPALFVDKIGIATGSQEHHVSISSLK